MDNKLRYILAPYVPNLSTNNIIEQIKALVMSEFGEERYHSQLCRKNYKKGSYGVTNKVFEGNCGCIAYGYNKHIAEMKEKFK